MTLTAKPIVKNQHWVVTDGTKKIGNIVAEGTEFTVKIDNRIEHFDSTKTIEKVKDIQFVSLPKLENKKPPFAVFPATSNRIYNSCFDVKRKLHIFTKTPKSKCYHAAGWFAIKQTDTYEVVFCPKYIFIQRYEYVGPFMSEDEVNSSINKT
jgi:hypothetical protein